MTSQGSSLPATWLTSPLLMEWAEGWPETSPCALVTVGLRSWAHKTSGRDDLIF